MKRSPKLQQLHGQSMKYKSFPLPKGQNYFSSLPPDDPSRSFIRLTGLLLVLRVPGDIPECSSSSSRGAALSQQRHPKPLSALKDKAAAFISSCQQPPFPTLLLQTGCLVYYKECSYIMSRVHLRCSCTKEHSVLPSFLFSSVHLWQRLAS